MGHKILWHPKKFVDERTSKDFARDGYWFSLWGSIIVALDVLFLSLVLSKKGLFINTMSLKNICAIFLVSFSLYYVSNILIAYLTGEVVGMLKKEITFSKSLASTSYATFLLAVGIAISSIFAYFPGLDILAPIIVIIAIARGYGIYIRFLHEYTKLDNVEAYVVSVIVLSALVIGTMVGMNLVSLLLSF